MLRFFLQRFMLEKTAVINVFNSLKFKGKTTESSKMYKFVISQHSYTSLILYSCDYAAICILRCRKTVLKFRPFWNNFDEIIFDFVLSRVLQSGFEKKVFQEFCFFVLDSWDRFRSRCEWRHHHRHLCYLSPCFAIPLASLPSANQCLSHSTP